MRTRAQRSISFLSRSLSLTLLPQQELPTSTHTPKATHTHTHRCAAGVGVSCSAAALRQGKHCVTQTPSPGTTTTNFTQLHKTCSACSLLLGSTKRERERAGERVSSRERLLWRSLLWQSMRPMRDLELEFFFHFFIIIFLLFFCQLWLSLSLCVRLVLCNTRQRAFRLCKGHEK